MPDQPLICLQQTHATHTHTHTHRYVTYIYQYYYHPLCSSLILWFNQWPSLPPTPNTHPHTLTPSLSI